MTIHQEYELEKFTDSLQGMKYPVLKAEAARLRREAEGLEYEYTDYNAQVKQYQARSGMTFSQLKETDPTFQSMVIHRHDITDKKSFNAACQQKVQNAMRRIEELSMRIRFTDDEQIAESMRAARVFVSDLEFRTEHETKKIYTEKRPQKTITMPDGTLKRVNGKRVHAIVWKSYDPEHPTLTAEVKKRHDEEMASRWAKFNKEHNTIQSEIIRRRREALHV